MGDGDYIYRGFGAVTSPLQADTTNKTLCAVCDPVRDRLLALFATAINYELGGHATTPTATSAWAVARADTVLAAKAPVADTMPAKPKQSALQEAKFTFPLLALYRGAEEDEEFTLEEDLIRSTWGLHYILGPLTAEDSRKLKDALVFVHRLINRVIDQRGHPGYESGADQFNADTGGLNSIKLTSCAYEPEALIIGGPAFHGAHMTLETTELDTEADGLSAPFEGVTIHGGIAGPEGLLPGRIVGDTSVALQAPIGKPQPE